MARPLADQRVVAGPCGFGRLVEGSWFDRVPSLTEPAREEVKIQLSQGLADVERDDG
jgi:hypothetical protein